MADKNECFWVECAHGGFNFQELTYCVFKGYYEAVVDFVKKGVNINFVDNNHSPLTWACIENRTRIAEYLLKHGATYTIFASEGHSSPVVCSLHNLERLKLFEKDLQDQEVITYLLGLEMSADVLDYLISIAKKNNFKF